MKNIKIFISAVFLINITGCLKDKPNVDFSGLKTVVQMPYSGKGFFGADAVTDLSDTVQVTFTVNIASTYPLSKDLKVTVAVDPTLVGQYNTYDPSVHYEPLPAAAYSFNTTTLTIPAGKRLDTLTVTFYRAGIDPTKSFMLPIVIKDASGEIISGNMSVHYYHFIGNPLAGSYTYHFLRWNLATPTGTPVTEYIDVNTFLPDDPTTIQVTSGYYVATERYVLKFENNNGVLSNFTLAFNAKDVTDIFTANGISVTDGPNILMADPVAKHFKFQYTVFNGSAYRYIIDEYYP